MGPFGIQFNCIEGKYNLASIFGVLQRSAVTILMLAWMFGYLQPKKGISVVCKF